MEWCWTFFIAPLLEYRPASSRWGLSILQAGYDSRKERLIRCLLPAIALLIYLLMKLHHN
jgi:hypothetical protein